MRCIVPIVLLLAVVRGQGARTPEWPDYGSAAALCRAQELHLERLRHWDERSAVRAMAFTADGAFLMWATTDGLHGVELAGQRGFATAAMDAEVLGMAAGPEPDQALAVLVDALVAIDAHSLAIVAHQSLPRIGDVPLAQHAELLLAQVRHPGRSGGAAAAAARLRAAPQLATASLAGLEVVLAADDGWAAVAGGTLSSCGTCARQPRLRVFAGDGTQLYEGHCSGSHSTVDGSPDGDLLAWGDGGSVTVVRTADWVEVGHARGSFAWWRFLDRTTAIAGNDVDLTLWYVPTMQVVERRTVARAAPPKKRRWPSDFWSDRPSPGSPYARAFALSPRRDLVAVQTAGEVMVFRVRKHR